MTGNLSEIDIPRMAFLLNRRRDNGTPTTLLLGARAGKLYLNQSFNHHLKMWQIPGAGNFDALSPLEQFQECFRILDRNPMSPSDLHQILISALQVFHLEASDLILAELIKSDFFNPLITSNIDSAIERSLSKVGLQNMSDFDIHVPRKEEDSVRRIPFEARIQIIKAYGDFESRDYYLNKRSQHLQAYKNIQMALDNARKRNVLVVGADPVWDEHLLSAVVPQSGLALWYVNDDPPPQDSPFYRLLEENHAHLFIKNEGNYESFFQKLHWQMMGDVPGAYTILVITELHSQELKSVENAFTALLSSPALLNTSLINFFGVDGIGKTSLLQEVKQRCGDKGIPCALVNASQGTQRYLQDLLKQLQTYRHVQQLAPTSLEVSLQSQGISAIKALLIENPLVIMLDAVDTHNTEQIASIEDMLKELIGYANLLIIIASKEKISFGFNPGLTRKVQPFALKPFDRVGSGAYLNRIAHDLEPSIRENIFEWTGGYPLAMAVMTQAILGDNLNLQMPEDRTRLFSIIMHLVIENKVFANVARNQLALYRAYFGLFSLPRRFNMTLFQELLTVFEPELVAQNPLSNLDPLSQIPRTTGLMGWDIQRTGFSIQNPVRTLFFQYCRLEQPERFRQIHSFLARYNLQSALNGDIQAWREYLYHCAFGGQGQGLHEVIQGMIQHIRAVTRDDHRQIVEEVAQDDELKEALGDHFELLSALIKNTFDSGN